MFVRYCNNLQLFSHLSEDFKSEEYLRMSHWALENTDQSIHFKKKSLIHKKSPSQMYKENICKIHTFRKKEKKTSQTVLLLIST